MTISIYNSEFSVIHLAFLTKQRICEKTKAIIFNGQRRKYMNARKRNLPLLLLHLLPYLLQHQEYPKDGPPGKILYGVTFIAIQNESIIITTKLLRRVTLQLLMFSRGPPFIYLSKILK